MYEKIIAAIVRKTQERIKEIDKSYSSITTYKMLFSEERAKLEPGVRQHCNRSEKMDKLTKLLASCKCGVYLTVNEHRDSYQSPADWLEDNEQLGPEMPDDIRAGILASGIIVQLQFFPDTPVGSHRIVHHDLDEALRQALECVGAA
jgi:hypothetical protein